MRVIIVHVDDGLLGDIPMEQVPRAQEWVTYKKQTYVVKQVIWNIIDTKVGKRFITAKLIVTEPED